MLRPSYSELMEIINEQQLADNQITSRYTIVLAAAKRARQIVDGARPLTKAPIDRAVSVAIKEIHEGRINIEVDEDMLDGNYEKMLRSQIKHKNITVLTKDDLREDMKENYPALEFQGTDDDDEIIDTDEITNSFMHEIDLDDEFEEKEHYLYENEDFAFEEADEE